MFADILVAIDGSDSASHAAEQALVLARAVDATVHVLSVVDTRAHSPGITPLEAVGAEAERTAVERSERAVEEAARRFEDELGEERVVTAVETGIPYEEIVEYATSTPVDLVVMGTHGRTGIKRLVIGSVTERVVRLSPRPVLTVHGTDDLRESFEEIVVPTDGTDSAEAAGEYATELATRFGGRVHALAVVDAAVQTGYFDGGMPVEDITDTLRKRAEDNVARIAETVTSAGVDAETAVRTDTVHRGILDYAEEVDADLLVMGTHGRAGLERYLLGSVTERIVRAAQLPVLTVHADSEDDEE